MSTKMRPIELKITTPDGREVVARRSGSLPDVFVTEDGQILQLKPLEQADIRGYAASRYRGTTLSSRILVADAWLRDWESFGSTVEPANGDQFDLRPSNLRPSRKRGRPAGGRIRWQAAIYQAMASLLEASVPFDTAMEIIAGEMETDAHTIITATRTFDPKLIPSDVKLPPKQRKRRIFKTPTNTPKCEQPS